MLSGCSLCCYHGVFLSGFMQVYFLYSTLGCHLCELAEQQLLPFVAKGNIEIEVVDIADEAGFIDSHGTRIPVLQHCTSGDELDWPFFADELMAFFTAHQ